MHMVPMGLFGILVSFRNFYKKKAAEIHRQPFTQTIPKPTI